MRLAELKAGDRFYFSGCPDRQWEKTEIGHYKVFFDYEGIRVAQSTICRALDNGEERNVANRQGVYQK